MAEANTETPTVEDLQSKLESEIGNAKTLRKRAQEAESRLADLEGKVFSDDDRKLFDTLKAEHAKAEEAKAKEQGEYDQLVEKMKKQNAEALEAKEAELQRLAGTITRMAGNDAITAALAENGAMSERLPMAAKLLMDRVSVDVKDGKAAVKVLDDDGTPMLSSAGEPVGVKQFVADWLKGQGSVFLPASGDSGSGSHGRGAPGEVTLKQLDADPQAMADYIRENGKEAYMKLVSAARKE